MLLYVCVWSLCRASLLSSCVLGSVCCHVQHTCNTQGSRKNAFVNSAERQSNATGVGAGLGAPVSPLDPTWPRCTLTILSFADCLDWADGPNKISLTTYSLLYEHSYWRVLFKWHWTLNSELPIFFFICGWAPFPGECAGASWRHRKDSQGFPAHVSCCVTCMWRGFSVKAPFSGDISFNCDAHLEPTFHRYCLIFWPNRSLNLTCQHSVSKVENSGDIATVPHKKSVPVTIYILSCCCPKRQL